MHFITMENGVISSKDVTLLGGERLIGLDHMSSSFRCVTFSRRWHQVLEVVLFPVTMGQFVSLINLTWITASGDLVC